jgi:glucose-1-phosphate thymidylyltransferase
MRAVILAAGEGKRMLPLTLVTPKPMLLVTGKPILGRIIDALPSEITELVIVIGYKSELIQNYFGDLYKGKLLTYITQNEPKGTYDALLQVRGQLHSPLGNFSEKFLLLNADDLHGASALAAAIQEPLALIVARHEDPRKFGIVSSNSDGTLQSIIEKPESFEDTLVSTGAMVLDERIFNYEVKPAANGELYLPVALQQLAAEYPVKLVEQPEWFPIGYPEDLNRAEELIQGTS